MKTSDIEKLFLEKYGNKIMASESWVIRFAEECVNASQLQQPNKEVSNEEIFKLINQHFANEISSISLANALRTLFSNTKTVEQDKWISVEERLPDDNQRILFCNNGAKWPREGVFLKEDEWKRKDMFCDGGFHLKASVYCWQPLPPAPGEKGGEG